jgi:potassium-transporting ATPase KdpC subunit
MNFKNLWTSAILLVIMTVITGLIYPLLITGIAQIAFPANANGSIIVRDGKVVGSALIGQSFTGPRYFHGRPSATGPFPYNALASSGSNLGPLHPALLDSVRRRALEFRATDSSATRSIPVDLVTASASGLDPHISVMAAFVQIARVARARGMSEDLIHGIVERRIEGRQFGVLGEPRVNVLLLNLDLDRISPMPERK